MAPSLATAAWAAWRAANLPSAAGFIERDLAAAIVKLGIRVPREARSAETLGIEREGTGVVIEEGGLILTIGYLLLEAESILVVANDGRVLPASVAGFDQVTGFGLVRASQPLGCRPLEFGDVASAHELNTAVIVTHPGAGGLSNASIVARRAFTGWWEYALDDALFTAPARDNHSGAALINSDGRLIGIGSLWVGDAINSGAAFPGNMFVPIDVLIPILPDLKAHGRRSGGARPWLGVYSEEVRGRVRITQVLRDSPAERSGMRNGDVVLAVDGQTVASQRGFYQALWSSGDAGVAITLQVSRNNAARKIVVRSTDRMSYLRSWPAAAH